MRAVSIALVAILAVVACAASAAVASQEANAVVASRFAAFRTRYGKVYGSAAEEAQRLRVFQENMLEAQRDAEANPHATFGVTPFSDLTRDEFNARHASGAAYFAAAMKRAAKPAEVVVVEAPDAKDWRDDGAVTPVKHQGKCNSCWTFSAIGNIESHWIIAGNKATDLSEQMLVSCDTTNEGCDGGLMDKAFDWIINNNSGNVFTEASYPYVSGNTTVDETCEMGDREVGATITGHVKMSHNEDEMAAWLAANGPISIGVVVSSMKNYKSGVLTACSTGMLDHAVLLVGYNKTAEVPYWIVKNSWGTEWGEDGYIRLEFGTNQCQLRQYACSAVVGDSASAAGNSTDSNA